MVDKELFDQRTYAHQRPRLVRLRDAGATVHLCHGTPPHGSMHAKACIVDRRRLYAGSPNFTYKSQYNVELAFRIVGPPVAEVLQFLSGIRRNSREWVGN